MLLLCCILAIIALVLVWPVLPSFSPKVARRVYGCLCIIAGMVILLNLASYGIVIALSLLMALTSF